MEMRIKLELTQELGLGGPYIDIEGSIFMEEYISTYSKFQKPHRKGRPFNYFEWCKAQDYLENHPV